ncbi:efflux RND transporter periplasmic adaptor subunit [Laedolimicola ammoniilytica]|uniref:Efflux RND transporter periplasmic adaptor subunit n=1 Tax=Laedolimicola ammoniilytica TaxID=2981771 RepID=A0ABT2RXD5_9FIRM|nr:efflux RND transporter periplasmic adaptor subunit [Laedolimicola ammoniilytica]MCU6696991.1 efflux RND transporter periplasmic adaptor subunit [Laedolimicola ammoniilytica]SCI03831.1 Efflux pump periplasmic linker BepF [uncultured Clostridium sp.]
MKKKSVLALGLVLAMSVSMVGCGSSKKTETEKVNVEVQTPQSGEVTLDTDYIGTVSPEQQVYVVPLVSGTVTQVNYAVGDTVKEGDVLFRIDDEAAQLQMDNARAAYSQAQAGVNAATGGARHLQNYQTEQGIDSMEDSLDQVRDSIKNMESQIDTLGTQETQLSQAVTAAQANVAAKNQALAQEQLKLESLQKAAEAGNASSAGSTTEAGTGSTGTAESGGTAAGETGAASGTAGSGTASGTAEAAGTTGSTGATASDLAIQEQKTKVATAQLELTQAQEALSQAQSGLSAAKSGKSQLESALDTTKTQKDTLKDNLNTTKETYEITKNEVYPQTDATYAAQLAQANVGLESAQYQMDMYTVKAPISGQIESISVEKDTMASAGNPAYVISNKDSMTVTFNVAEKAKNELKVGDAVEVERGGETFAGTITEVGTMAGPQTRLFQVKASVIGAGDKLPSGVSVKVHATTQREQSGLVIPYDAVYFSAGDAYVYCVENGKLVKTPITVGLMNDNEVSVEDGLNAESQVVTTWSSKLRDGAEVLINGANGAADDSQKEAVSENAGSESAGSSDTEAEDAE